MATTDVYVSQLQRVGSTTTGLVGRTSAIVFDGDDYDVEIVEARIAGDDGGSIEGYAKVSAKFGSVINAANITAALATTTDPLDLNGEALSDVSQIEFKGGAAIYSATAATTTSGGFAALQFAFTPGQTAWIRVALFGVATVSGLPKITKYSREWLVVNVHASAWQASHAYAVGDRAKNGGKYYVCVGAGTSAGSGGPSGTSTGIADGGATWDYLSSSAALVVDSATIGSDINAIGVANGIGIQIDSTGQLAQIGCDGKSATAIAWKCQAIVQVL